MATSRVLHALGVLLCALVLVSSHVAAGQEPTAASNVKEQMNAGSPIEESKACRYGCNLFYRRRCWICKPPPHGKPAADAAEAGDAADETAADAIIGENKAPPCHCCSYFRRRCARCCAAGEEAPA